MQNLLEHIENETQPTNDGVYWTMALFISEFFRASSFAIMYAVGIRTAIRSSNSVGNLLYNKILTTRSLANKTTGELINLFANDIHKVLHMIYIIPLSLGGPIVTFVTIVYTWWLLGIYALVGIIVFIIIFGLQFAITKGQSHYRKKAIIETDKRISLMTELLTYIKLIKLNAWENAFSHQILGKSSMTTILIIYDQNFYIINISFIELDQRKKEFKWLQICQYLQCTSTSLALMTPMITTIVTILTYTLAGYDDLTAAKVL